MTIRAGIIGAGNIGWRYDLGRWDGVRSISHASCLERHPKTSLVAIFDPDPDPEARKFCREHQNPKITLSNDIKAFLLQKLDLVCIASPSEHHPQHLRDCWEAKVPMILCEKPVATDFTAYQELLRDEQNLDYAPRISVNYFRRHLPQADALRQACANERPLGIEVTYSRGLAVNGVHLLDLVAFILDLQTPPQLLWHQKNAENPSLGFGVDGLTVHVRGFDLPYHCTEIVATFANERLALRDGGNRFERERRQENADYPGFFHLAPPEPVMDEKLCQQAVRDGTYLGLCNLIDENLPLNSNLRSAGFAQQIMKEISLA